MAKSTNIPYTKYEKDAQGKDTDELVFSGSFNGPVISAMSLEDFKKHEAHLKDAGLEDADFATIHGLAKAATAPKATVAPGLTARQEFKEKP
ncbi:MAG TPA: hypothetical protein VK628_05060 [Flavitalea sp.]|nr:hypothetical protein [Flavitalea sp.]